MKYSVYHENSNTASLLGKKAGIRAAQGKWASKKAPILMSLEWATLSFLSCDSTFKFQEQSENK